ncbi:carboxypeptidase regulatory-like domain-containing protein [Actinoplanes sp. RD1]|uniref:carboxypeptidase regulatory-like domain-containing protein n=1 Tax=Actinoplanes sp. RD1 TaxID=3064538 RepID=UPI00274078BE|nr:carboxypeptidase regulatory-like domain-containing protein [Actinoplanes sp. RD1]
MKRMLGSLAAILVVAGSLIGTPASAAPAAPAEKPAACNEQQQAKAGEVPRARCYAVQWSDPKAKRAAAAGPLPTALGPADIQDAYQLPDGGDGMTVAIVDAYGYTNAEADLAVWRDHYGLPACTTDNGCFRKVDQRGGTDYPPQDEGWAGEQALDLDAVSAVCPRCDILLVQSDTSYMDDMGAAVNMAVELGAMAVSNSYGIDGETPYAQQFDQYYDHPGVVVTVSSGDTGNVQSYPATSPYVTGVGGTRLDRDDSARGWHETAWDEAGSGCSVYEPKPDWQAGVDTACASRASADISALADPATGLSVYGTYGIDGWAQYGGTSLSAPLVAAMHALAGAPTPGTYPVTYPYATGRGLFDITEGTNGTCGDQLCEASPGWDGPTGLGSPQGVSALTLGDSGDVVGTVTDTAGKPIKGATVTASSFTATTGTDGKYDLHATAGTYDLAVTAFGYSTAAKSVTVTTGEKATADFTLTALASKTVSGVVKDGSGHGWPLGATITIDGYPDGAVHSDPFTGEYSVTLPAGKDYTFHVSAEDLPGYASSSLTVNVAAKNVTKNIAVPVLEDCTAPGYGFQDTGVSESFTGWTGTTAKNGWTITDAAGTGQTWNFDTYRYANPVPDSDGELALVDSDIWGEGGKQDTYLVSPVVDLSGHAKPELAFDSYYVWFPDQSATIDLSLDGGTSWQEVFSLPSGGYHIDLPLPQLANQKNVQVRFHFVGGWSRSWLLDNVLVGTRSCEPLTGGLVAGVVKDDNTLAPLAGAVVTSDKHPTEFGVTDEDGYYWLYSSSTGSTTLTATNGRYTPAALKVSVKKDGLKRADVRLKAGLLTVNKSSLSAEVVLGKSATAGTITFGNDGQSPVAVHLGEDSGGFSPYAHQTGAAARTVKTQVSDAEAAGASQTPPVPVGADAAPWSEVADYPDVVLDNLAAASHGKVYSVGGTTGFTRFDTMYVYDPATKAWTAGPSLPKPIAGHAGGFIGDTLYVTGGWDGTTAQNRATYAYSPKTGTWTQKADLPAPAAKAGSAIAGGKLYVIAGCTTSSCTRTNKVHVYDPATDTWSAAPDYPATVSYLNCGGFADEVICTGGTAGGANTFTDTWTLTPGAGAWVKKEALPADLWGAATTVANGRFQVMGGVVQQGSAITNQAYEYNPATDTWAALPNVGWPTYRGAAACGIYKVGGAYSGLIGTPWVETLPGYIDCGTDVPWLSLGRTDFTVAPGRTVAVKVTADSSVLDQLGTYEGQVLVTTDSPYATPAPVAVSLTVTPPATWGQIAGTVTSKSGAAVPGATVALCVSYDTATGDCGPATYTLTTDAGGAYHLWLDAKLGPVQVIAAKDGYTPAMKLASLTKGTTTTTDFALTPNSTMTPAAVAEFLAGHRP